MNNDEQSMSCPTPGPARLKGFSVPLSRVKYEKALCACASFCVCFFLSDWKCINCNSICPVFLRTSMRWRFSLLIGLDWGAKLRVTLPRNIGARLVTASVAHWFDSRDSRIFFWWLFYVSDSSHLQNSNFSISSLSGCKYMPDSLVSKRWKYRMIKSNFLGLLQSKLAESDGLSVLEND